ncbi:MAG: DUF1464 family protein, partial [Sulfolobales archaeon]
MIFAGIDPGSESYGIAFVDELGRIIKYIEVPTDLIPKYVIYIIKLIRDLRPSIVALPSGHGLPFVNSRQIGDNEIFYMTLADPNKTGHLRSFLRYSFLIEDAYTIPSVKELESIAEYKKINVIDLGTSDKVASAFFYRTFFESFVLVELGRKFSSIIVVKDGRIIDGFGGTFIGIPGGIDGELVYLISNFSKQKISKESIYNVLERKRGLEIIRIIAEWYSSKIDAPIIVSGKNKHELEIGLKFEFKFKEAAVGAADIANAIGSGIFRRVLEMLK